MAIIFGSDTGIRIDSFETVKNKFVDDLLSIGKGIASSFSLITKNAPPPAAKEIVHVDSGFSNVPGTSFLGSTIDNVDDIQQRRTTSQEPVLTVYVKKRAFRALRNENDLKLLDSGEKLFLRATKNLFERKCQQIASYEALSKVKSLISEDATVDSDRISAIIDYFEQSLGGEQKIIQDDLSTAYESGNLAQIDSLTSLSSELKEIEPFIDGLREIQKKAGKLRSAVHTTWVVDTQQPDLFLTGRGAGVIELTLISDLNTSLSIDGNDAGSINFTIQDPYNLTKITNDDIEYALSSSKAELSSSLNISLGPQAYLDDARTLEEKLRKKRKNRVANAFGLGDNSGNAILSGADATEIVFEINPTSVAHNKVVATVGEMPEAFDKNNFRIALLQLSADQMLDYEEDQMVEEIFNLLENYVLELEKLNNTFIADNGSPDVMHARRNLRLHYLGKNIVQPMDSVNIYIRSNTFEQDELVGPLSVFLNNSTLVRSFEENQELTDALLEEEMKILGVDNLGVTVDWYKKIRSGSLFRNAGTHVFGGVITNVAESYSASSGVYLTKVGGKSNMYWLDQSRVNRAPSLDQTQGLLEDPLTAFDIKTDEGTGLIVDTPPINQETQRRIDAGLITFDNGSHAGEKLDPATNFVQDFMPSENDVISQYKHAPGIVYKWKQGVMVATRNVNLKTALDGTENQSAKLRREMGMTVVNDPFSGQDAADIVSMLVTGYPHNYESFYDNAKSTGTFNNSSQSNSPESYFHSFFDINRTQNRTFGNFQPFKTINVDPAALSARLGAQQFLKTTSNSINSLLSRLAQLLGQRDNLSKQFDGVAPGNVLDVHLVLRGQADVIITGLDKAIQQVKDKINAAQVEFKKQCDKSKDLRIYGTDLALDFDVQTAESETEGTKLTNNQTILRNSIMQFRSQYDCKFNTDNNLFLVGDEYDKDLDIQAFVRNMSQNISMFESQFKTPKEICTNVAKTLDFEFYCDSMGHLQFRPPRYNKTPLSLLLKMFLLDKQEGNKIYPAFLQNLFKTQRQYLSNEVDICRLNIDIERILLGDITINVKAGSIMLDSNLSAISPKDLSSELTGTLTEVLLEKKSSVRVKTGGASIDTESKEETDAARKEIAGLNDPSDPNMYSKRLAHINKLAQLVSKRQKLETQLANIKNQYDKYNSDMPGGISQNMSPDLLANFRDLIEDDLHDFLGPKSAKRFIIYDSHLIQYDFTESSDNVVCRVDVNGEQDLIGEGPGNLGGIPILWAGATDFDLWRQYGYRCDGGVSRPFFKDAETQCAPYAVMLLSRNRKNAVRGSITITGNEYYQLGDVVYINSRDTLYYVTGISHSFSYESGSFTTSLTLEYGHPLGEYIPAPLDIIGKGLIKAQRKFNKVVTSRLTASESIGRHLGAVIFPIADAEDEYKQMLSGEYANFNLNELKNALAVASLYVSADAKDTTYPKIEVRGFITDYANEGKVTERIKAVIKWAMKPTGLFYQSNDENLEERYSTISEEYIKKSLNKNNISGFVSPVKINEDFSKGNSAIRMPKEEVFNLSNGLKNKIENIIDIVLIFEDLSKKESAASK